VNFVGADDFNGDGLPDAVTTNSFVATSRNVSLLLNRGEGKLAPAVDYSLGHGTLSFATADLDDDGDPDMAVAYNDQPGFVVVKTAGGALTGDRLERTSPSPVQTLAAGDFDGDRDIDLAAVGGERYIGVFLNEGDGSFADPGNHEASSRPAFVRAGDLDGDGDLDLAATNLGTDDVTVLWNDGAGGFPQKRQASLRGGWPWHWP
jgi:hypothetical protein